MLRMGMNRYNTHQFGLPIILITQNSLYIGIRDFHPSTLAFSNNFQYPIVTPILKISKVMSIAVTVS